MPTLTPFHTRWRQLALALLLCSGLAACGGGSDGGDTASPGTGGSGSATLGAAGGRVLADDGTRVDLPSDALASDTTIRIAQDSAGAPAVPTGLRAAGPMRAFTPHGITFAQPATVRLPRPDVALAPNEKLMLAKAESATDSVWQILADTTERDGMLEAQVQGFSYFLPVIVPYTVAVIDLRPVKIERIEVLNCGDQNCQDMVGPSTVNVRVTLSGTQLPSFCPDPAAGWTLFIGPHRVAGPVAGNIVELALPNDIAYGPYANPLWVRAGMRCALGDRHLPDISAAAVPAGKWRAPATPGLLALPLPATLQVVDGRDATLDAILMGGAQGFVNLSNTDLAADDSATVFWERSDDQGASWKTVAQSFQFEAERQPFGGPLLNVHWSYWRVRHGFVAQASDAGVQLRVRACYTPPAQTSTICATSNATTLVVAQASAFPVITAGPQSVLVRTGQTASWTAAATGTPVPALQWQTRPANGNGAWADVPGATGSHYTTAVLGLADNGLQVRVVAANALGEAQSTGATVSVSDLDVAPTITTQPATIAVAAGGDAVFAVAARGTEALSYQWRFNGSPVAGANAAVLKLAAVTGAQAGRYSVVVGNAAGSVTSVDATLDVTSGAPAAQPPSIVTQPVSVLVNAGNTATLAVGVAGTGPLGYQWLKNGQPIAGATAATYSVAAATPADAGSYAVQVGNAVGRVTSADVVITVEASAAPQPVSIATPPSPQVQLPGGSATFAVAASGSGPFSYQWLKDGAPIGGATGAVLLLSGVTGNDAGSYAVTVSGALGAVTSDGATLTVVGAPAITGQPVAQTVKAGDTATFSVVASGSGLRYQWTRDSLAIEGATGASYTTPALSQDDSGAVYGVIVYNGAGIVISGGAVVTVSAAATPLLATAVAAGFGSSYAVDTQGDVWAWGYLVDPVTGGYKASAPWATAPVRVQGLSNVESVVVVSETGNAYALHTDGTVSAWGRNDVGQLGDQTTTTRALPVKVLDGGDWANPPPIADICRIAAGNSALAMAPCDGSPVQMVGLMSSTNFGGATGSGLTPNGGVAKAVPGLPSGTVVAMGMPDAAANAQGGLLLSYSDGRVFAWGAQTSNSLGAGPGETRAGTAVSAVDVTVTFGPNGNPVDKIEMGRDFTLVRWGGGAVQGLGRNVEGQLGNGSTTSRTTLDYVGGAVNVGQFSVGQVNAAALVDGDVWIWGWHNGSMFNAPTRLTTGGGFAQLSLGDQHGLLIDTAGRVQAWGNGSYGALGTGAASASLPVVVMRP